MKHYSCEQEAAFYKENDYAIQQLWKAILHRGQQLKLAVKEVESIQEFRQSEAGMWVTEEVYDTLSLYTSRYSVPERELLRDWGGRAEQMKQHPLIHVFGDWKIGEIGRTELAQDLATFVTKEEDGSYFDLDHCISVAHDMTHSFEEDHDILPTDTWDIASAPILLEFHSVLVRLRNSERWVEEGEVLEEALLRNVWSKIILFQLALQYELPTYTKSIISKHWKKRRGFVNLILFYTVYSSLYERINGLMDGNQFERTLEEQLARISDTLFHFGSKTGLPIAIDFLKAKIASGSVRRYIHILWDTFLTTYSQATHTFVLGPDKQYRAASYLKQGHLVSGVGIESVQSWLETLTSEEEAPSHISALYTCVGLESVMAPGDKYYDNVKRMDRTKLLLQLSSKQRNIYRKYEGELLRLRADMVACRTPEAQKALIGRSVTLGKLIGIELEANDEDEIYGVLLLGLDNDRVDLTEVLANRDFKKERNTMLYGQLKTKTNWDY